MSCPKCDSRPTITVVASFKIKVDHDKQPDEVGVRIFSEELRDLDPKSLLVSLPKDVLGPKGVTNVTIQLIETREVLKILDNLANGSIASVLKGANVRPVVFLELLQLVADNPNLEQHPVAALGTAQKIGGTLERSHPCLRKEEEGVWSLSWCADPESSQWTPNYLAVVPFEVAE